MDLFFLAPFFSLRFLTKSPWVPFAVTLDVDVPSEIARGSILTDEVFCHCRDTQCFEITKNTSRRTHPHVLCFIIHDRARKVNGLQHTSRGRVSGPILPVKKNARTNRFDECNFHRVPVGRILDLCSLIRLSEHSCVERKPGTDSQRTRCSKGF